MNTRLAALPKPVRIAIGLLAAHAVYLLVALGVATVLEGTLHWYVWLSSGGFAVFSAICASGLARGARWAWWVAVILHGRRALMLGAALVGMIGWPENSGGDPKALALTAAWFALSALILGLLLARPTRRVYTRRQFA